VVELYAGAPGGQEQVRPLVLFDQPRTSVQMPGGPLLELMQGQDMQALISACNACVTTGKLILRKYSIFPTIFPGR
jgi:hypothetical protein